MRATRVDHAVEGERTRQSERLRTMLAHKIFNIPPEYAVTVIDRQTIDVLVPAIPSSLSNYENKPVTVRMKRLPDGRVDIADASPHAMKDIPAILARFRDELVNWCV